MVTPDCGLYAGGSRQHLVEFLIVGQVAGKFPDLSFPFFALGPGSCCVAIVPGIPRRNKLEEILVIVKGMDEPDISLERKANEPGEAL
ncbi:unnamed protein product [Caretta caretta]